MSVLSLPLKGRERWAQQQTKEYEGKSPRSILVEGGLDREGSLVIRLAFCVSAFAGGRGGFGSGGDPTFLAQVVS